MKKIVHADENGKLIIVTPSKNFVNQLKEKHPDWDEEMCIKHIADKDLETGTKYSIVTEEELKAAFGTNAIGAVNRLYRDAWEYTAPEKAETSNDLSEEDAVRYGKI
jgi:hypothetical protein